MASDNNQSDTEDPNSEILKYHFLFSKTHEVEFRNSKIIAAFNGELGASIARQKDSQVKYVPEFRNTAALVKLFFYNEEKNNIINIIQQRSCYHLHPIKGEIRK